MYRTLLGIVFSLLAALSVVGLTFSASVEEPAQFRFGNGSEPRTLDPGVATGQPEHRLIAALFEGLTRLEAKSLS
jgi:oligopeptide transport system substrate-binding protein